MIAKGEKLAKFMCDLTADQDTKQLLLTEADYNAAGAVKEEIVTLQPPGKDEARAEILNEWNIESDEDNDDAEVDDEGSCSDASKQDDSINEAVDKHCVIWNPDTSGRKNCSVSFSMII